MDPSRRQVARRAGSRRAPRHPSRLVASLRSLARSPWTRVTCAAVAGVSLGLLTGVVLTKQVRLTVDGGETTIRSFGGTVREVLAAVKIEIGPLDEVRPAPDEQVEDGATIDVRHARPLLLTVDGRTTRHTVTALNVGEALRQLDLDGRRATLSHSRMRQIPMSGFALSVRTERRVTVVRGGVRLDALTTGRTVRAVLVQQKITLARGDTVRPPMNSFPEDSQVIRIIPAAPRTPAGSAAAAAPARRALREAAPRTRAVRLAAPPARAVAISSSVASLNWAALANCETRSDPKAFNPSGPYYGMYQISLPMWRAAGGTGTPLDWPAAEQTYRAQVLYQKVQGRWRTQWPNCGARLFNR